MERLIINGNMKITQQKLSEIMDSDNVDIFIKYFHLYNRMLDDSEYFTVTEEYAGGGEGMTGLMIKKLNLNINLKLSTVWLVALLLDIGLTKGFTTVLLNLYGVHQASIKKIDVTSGELCCLIEFKADKNLNPVEFLKKCRNGCINCDISCRFRKEDMCTMKLSEITACIDKFIDAKVFCMVDGKYKYNL